MGPPREHGGRAADKLSGSMPNRGLQWGRRVNTAEGSNDDGERHALRDQASMGPPREHGGRSIANGSLPYPELSFNGAAA